MVADGVCPRVEQRDSSASRLKLSVPILANDLLLRKKRTVSIPAALYAQLVDLNQTQPSALVEAILTTWLSKSPEEQRACLLVAGLLKREEKNESEREKRAKIAEREAAKAERRAKREAEKLAQKAERRAFYEAERAAAAAERDKREAERVSQRAARKAENEQLRLKQAAEKEETAAKQKSIRGIEPSLYGKCKIGKVSKFSSLDEAAAAAERYSAVKGYDLEGFACEKCNGFHIRSDEKKYAEKFAAARQKAMERALGTPRAAGKSEADVSAQPK